MTATTHNQPSDSAPESIVRHFQRATAAAVADAALPGSSASAPSGFHLTVCEICGLFMPPDAAGPCPVCADEAAALFAELAETEAWFYGGGQ